MESSTKEQVATESWVAVSQRQSRPYQSPKATAQSPKPKAHSPQPKARVVCLWASSWQGTGVLCRGNDSRQGAAASCAPLPAPAKTKTILQSEQTSSLTKGKGTTHGGIVHKYPAHSASQSKRGWHCIFHRYLYIINNTSTGNWVFTSVHSTAHNCVSRFSKLIFVCIRFVLDNHLWTKTLQMLLLWERGLISQARGPGTERKGNLWRYGTENTKRKGDYEERKWKWQKEELARAVLKNRIRNIRDPVILSLIAYSFSTSVYIYIPWACISSFAHLSLSLPQGIHATLTLHLLCCPPQSSQEQSFPGKDTVSCWMKFWGLSTLHFYLRSLNALYPWILHFLSPHRKF